MNNSQKWINAGYEIFAREGPEGIQVERLARILGLNKSGFYHYFGDHDLFFEHLVQHHYKMVDLIINDIDNLRSFDPGFLHVMINHSMTIQVNRQLLHNRHIKLFECAFNEANAKMEYALTPAWSTFLGIVDQPELALRSYKMTHALLYTHITSSNLNYEFLHGLVSEAKMIFEEMAFAKTVYFQSA